MRNWLLSIARNLVIDHHRRDHSADQIAIGYGRGSVDEERLPPSPSFAGDLGLDPEIEGALRSLTRQAREIIALRFGADMSGPEISELTGLSLANVQQILSRSLRAMRDQIDPQAFQPDP